MPSAEAMLRFGERLARLPMESFMERTIADILSVRASNQGQAIAFQYVRGENDARQTMTYQELHRRAQLVACALLQTLQPGDRVLMLYPAGLEFISAFFGCLYAGIIPAPAYPPRKNQNFARLDGIVRDAGAAAVLTLKSVSEQSQAQFRDDTDLGQAPWFNTDELERNYQTEYAQCVLPQVGCDDTAFIQYTSGSTGDPKGVVVTHRNIIANSKVIQQRFTHSPESHMVSWLPLFHDMGLLGTVLQPIFVGFPATLMSPAHFLQKPIRWLQEISRQRATSSGAPNFAFDLCVDEISDADLRGLDLSSWQRAFNGAEVVRADTLTRFAAKFASCGFKPEAFFPCYGMAETTLMVSGADHERRPRTLLADKAALLTGKVITSEDEAAARALISCGTVGEQHQLLIVDPITRLELAEHEVGEIWVKGPSVSPGYWNQPQRNEEVFQAWSATERGPFLRTGDLGFLSKGELFVTGRLKDVMVIRGRNYSPHDVEATVASASLGLVSNGGAAFLVDVAGRDALVVVQEVERTALRTLALAETLATVKAAIAREHDLSVYDIVLVKPGRLLRTSSGKVQRARNASAYLANQYEPVARLRDPESAVDEPSEVGDTDQQGIERWLVAQIAALAGSEPTQIDLHASFDAHGLNSVDAIRLAGRLGEWLQRELSPVLIYDYPSIAQLACFLSQSSARSEKPAMAEDIQDIAVIGMDCRFPGAQDVEAFWQLLEQGGNAIDGPSAQRVADCPGLSGRKAGYLEDIDQFDLKFFGITPKEGRFVDPQHRLLLEASYNALTAAGYAPSTLRDRNVAVFVGISQGDYAGVCLDRAGPGPYLGTGNALSIAANRISYSFDLKGPSVAIDTACSSSLVAVHEAIRSLRGGDSCMAVAAGVNLILSSAVTEALDQANMLSADAQCKVFDARADGYVRAEGCGAVVLKPLATAVADRDPIIAVIKGSAVAQDGRSNGLTAPNGVAQRHVIGKALADARVDGRDIGYVEAHGTGTELGDPIEVAALVQAYGLQREKPVTIGSVKANIGHLESAAGMAGLIKTLLCVQRGKLVPQINVEHANPLIKWQGVTLVEGSQVVGWPIEGPRLAGVSSFGFGGTNAHLIVAQAPSPDTCAISATAASPVVALLSAKTQTSLVAMMETWAHRLRYRSDLLPLGAVCAALASGRDHFEYRFAAAVESTEQLIASLQTQTPRRATAAPPLAMLFSGQGCQYVGMGRALYQAEPVFATRLRECAELFDPYLEQPLLEVMWEGPATLLQDTRYTQAALFCFEVAMAHYWISLGVRPQLLCGHSLGEYAAACVAGVFSLSDAVRLVATRARLMAEVTEPGAMVVVFCAERLVTPLLKDEQQRVAVAARNGPESVVVAGCTEALARIVDALRQQGVESKYLDVTRAFHSPLMRTMLDEFAAVASQIDYQRASIELVSNVTGQCLGERIADAQYWVEHTLAAVEFAAGVRTMHACAIEVYLEVGPSGTLLSLVDRAISRAGRHHLISSQRRGANERMQLAQAQASLYGAGVELDWSTLYPKCPTSLCLPGYAFDRQRVWVEASSRSLLPETMHIEPLRTGLLGAPIHLVNLETPQFYESLVSAHSPGYMQDHVVFGAALFPMAGYIDMALSAARAVFRSNACVVSDLQVSASLTLQAQPVRLQSVITGDDAQGYHLAVFSQAGDDQPWLAKATANLQASATTPPVSLDWPGCHEDGCTSIDKASHYALYRQRGIEYGPTFAGVEQVRYDGVSASGWIDAPDHVALNLEGGVVPPPLLDAALQVLGHALPQPGANESYLPVAVTKVIWSGAYTPRMHVVAQLCSAVDDLVYCDLELSDQEGRFIALLQGVGLKRVPVLCRTEAANENGPASGASYRVEWRRQSAFANERRASLECLSGVAASLALRLDEDVKSPRLQRYAEALEQLDELALSYIAQALLQSGWCYQLDEHFTLTAAMGELCIVPAQASLFRRVLQILGRHGWLGETPHGWQVVRNLADLARSVEVQRTGQEQAQAHAEVALLQRCGSRLADVLQGRQDPVELIFPDGDTSAVAAIYQEGPQARVMNSLVQQCVSRLVEHAPPRRGIRILEIGAGTGGTSRYLLPYLSPEQTRYCFTDIGKLFLAKARQAFGEYTFVGFQSLDIEQDPVGQGLPTSGFDIVIAANVLHATTSISQTLQHVNELLTPGGVLVLLESTSQKPWLDLTFGMLDGWWRFADRTLRSDHPLLDGTTWTAVLAEAGFAKVEALPRAGQHDQGLHQTLLLAQRSQEMQRRDSPPCWIVFTDQRETACHLLGQLREHSLHVIEVFAGEHYAHPSVNEFVLRPQQPDDHRALLEALKDTSCGPYRFVYLWGQEAEPVAECDTQKIASLTADACAPALYLAQALTAGTLHAEGVRLDLITSGLQAVGLSFMPEHVLAQSPLPALAKVIRLEHPQVTCTVLDLDPQASALSNAQALYDELMTDGSDDLVALRSSERYVARLHAETDVTATDRDLCRLQSGQKGELDSLYLETLTRSNPGPGQVCIEVRATGLNFLDLVRALDLLPGDVNGVSQQHLLDSEGFGWECSGVVRQVGDGVVSLRPGDPVIALAAGSFATYVNVDVRHTAPKPQSLTYAQAASLPVNYLTAYYALIEIGKLKAGERVLIHAASGGTGMAAVRVAQSIGAEVFATASPEKWEVLRQAGVRHLFHSRNTAYAQEILEQTLGAGVDLVLNSLTSDGFIPASLAVTAQGGRFIELAKKDVWTTAAMAAARPDVDYRVVDLVRTAMEAPEYVQSSLQRIVKHFDAGLLPVPLVHEMPFSEALGAFKRMQRATHAGKIVVVQPPRAPRSAPVGTGPISADKSYLITGGLGGLGLLVAGWLVERGARDVILLGRRLPDHPASARIDQLRASGARVTVHMADVSDFELMRRVFERIAVDHAPLAGVIHSAGCLHDAVLAKQSWRSFETVAAPKAWGAWNLHRLTAGIELDWFVMFSSMASLFGSPGQANHSAANAFLDALATHRCARGLPALSIHWGTVSQVGEAAELQADVSMARRGLGAISPHQFIDALERLIDATGVVAFGHIDWPLLTGMVESWTFLEAWRETLADSPAQKSIDVQWAERIRREAGEAREQCLAGYLQHVTAQVMGLTEGTVLLDEPLPLMGIDSLMAVELRNRAQRELRLEVPITLFMDDITLAGMAKELVRRLEEQDVLLTENKEVIEYVEGAL